MVNEATQNTELIQEGKKEWGLYVHWPFCLSKCPYCDFNSHVRDAIDSERWGRALIKELVGAAEQAKVSDRKLVSIFFGGGTPSLMSPDWVKEIIKTARSLGSVASDLEITLEANPTSSEMRRFEAFAQAGVTRLSLGVQAFCTKDLMFLGRTHSGDQARQAITWAADIFERFSFDLIYALPHQEVNSWEETLEDALSYKPSHLSCYQLTYEPGTAFYPKFERGELKYPEENQAIALYEATENMLASQGLYAYEVSNYAKSGQECRHNLLYWRYKDYLGIGPGAHGRWMDETSKIAQVNIRAPETWLKAVEDTGSGAKERDVLSAREMFHEWLLMGLRLKEGIDTEICQTLTEKSWKEWVSPPLLKPLLEEEFLVQEEKILRLSPKGRLVMNKIVDMLTGKN